MKILLANPPTRTELSGGYEKYFIKAGSRWPFSCVKKRDTPLFYVPFPFYLAYTSALLKSEGFKPHVIDGVALNYTKEEFLDEVCEIKPDLILVESSTPTIDYDLELLKELKSRLPSMRIVLSGPHVTVFPKEILDKNRYIDFLLLAEYETSFLELVKSKLDKKKAKSIKGIAFLEGGKLFMKEPELIDINKLPFPDRDSFPSTKKRDLNVYWDGFCQLKPCIQMHASRGCPFRCNFCLWNQVMYRNGRYRPFDPKRVVDEMELCKKRYGAKEIYFDDDTFTGNKNHVLEICNEILKRRLNIKWSCMGDAMVTDKEMLDRMKQAGCIGIKFGVESGNKEILKLIGKPVNLEKIKEFCKWCSERKIKSHGTFTLGLTGETRETMMQTVNLAKELDIDSVQFSINTPFPGTRYYEALEKDGKILSHNWSEYDGTCTSIVDFETIPRKEVVNYYSNARNDWLKVKTRDPRWLYRQICFNLRASLNRGPRFFLYRVKRLIHTYTI